MSDKIIEYIVDLDNLPPLTEEQKAELAVLAKMPDSHIDFSDIPRQKPIDWVRAVRLTSTHSASKGNNLAGSHK